MLKCAGALLRAGSMPTRGFFVFGNEIDFVTKIQQVAGKLRKMHVLCVFSNKTLTFSRKRLLFALFLHFRLLSGKLPAS